MSRTAETTAGQPQAMRPVASAVYSPFGSLCAGFTLSSATPPQVSLSVQHVGPSSRGE